MNRFGTIGDDGCPCGEYHDKDIRIIAHCWKSNGFKNCRCQYSGIHYQIIGDVQKAMSKLHAITEYINTAWCTEVNVIQTEVTEEDIRSRE